MTRVSFALMGHPRRQAFIDTLAPEIPGIEIVMDRRNDRWDTGRRSVLAFDPAASHHCVVQDDALLCRDFVEGVHAVAASAGEHPVGLYVGRVRPYQETVTPAVERALRIGAPWLAMEGPWWGVAIILPTSHIPDAVAWGDRHPEIANYDRRLSRFYAERGIDCWYTIPSLVDHRPVTENPSLVPRRTGNRRAHTFFADRSPLEVDWSLPPLRPDSLAVFRHDTGEIQVARPRSPLYRRLTQRPEWTEVIPDADVPLAPQP